jgi:hypothetical protein
MSSFLGCCFLCIIHDCSGNIDGFFLILKLRLIFIASSSHRRDFSSNLEAYLSINRRHCIAYRASDGNSGFPPAFHVLWGSS